MSFKVKLRKTDRLFRKYILKRDNYTCQRCGHKYNPSDNLQGLHVSHYWGRGRENTRFDPENCLLLCFNCHRIWGHGDGRQGYTDFMKQRLGEQGFLMLEIRAHQYQKRDDILMEIYITQLLRFLGKNEEVCRQKEEI